MSPASFLSWSSAATISTLMPREATASVHRKAGQAYSIQRTHCICASLVCPYYGLSTLQTHSWRHVIWSVVIDFDLSETVSYVDILRKGCASRWRNEHNLLARKYLKLHAVSVCIELQPRVPPVWRDKWISDYCLLNNGFASADHGTRSHNSIIRQAGRWKQSTMYLNSASGFGASHRE